MATVAGCSSGGDDGDDEADGTTVEMADDFAFDPDEIAITAGETVVWKVVESMGHTVTAYEGEIPDDAEYFASGGFDSEQAARDGYKRGQEGGIQGGESYEHTFETAGVYEYFCIPHEWRMVGTIEVREE